MSPHHPKHHPLQADLESANRQTQQEYVCLTRMRKEAERDPASTIERLLTILHEEAVNIRQHVQETYGCDLLTRTELHNLREKDKQAVYDIAGVFAAFVMILENALRALNDECTPAEVAGLMLNGLERCPRRWAIATVRGPFAPDTVRQSEAVNLTGWLDFRFRKTSANGGRTYARLSEALASEGLTGLMAQTLASAADMTGNDPAELQRRVDGGLTRLYPQEEKQPLSLDAPSEAGVPLIETLAGQDAYVQMETGLEIESYLSCLTPDESHAITLKSQGSTDEEIAQWMGKSLFAAKDALKRARKKAETHRKKI